MTGEQSSTRRASQPIGISRDSPWTHIAWTQALDLNFGLLSDLNGEAVRAFGIAQEFRGLKDVAERSAFLLDSSGIVRGAWHYESERGPRHRRVARRMSRLD